MLDGGYVSLDCALRGLCRIVSKVKESQYCLDYDLNVLVYMKKELCLWKTIMMLHYLLLEKIELM